MNIERPVGLSADFHVAGNLQSAVLKWFEYASDERIESASAVSTQISLKVWLLKRFA
ncbi:hypothetical protein [Burkholderia sp. SRS-W-2-2016]|uniref:hypothetical protein n=1 Tax=Burkholderia sp. SRS-W-2-2016 TaxID=1926878 RepID=UPI0015BF778D|nr:hypothetical protein [Burkholderia sp. SRS-W-2-2016]